MKKLCLFALVPALCNVNEPLIFGIPLMLNPAFAIPFFLVPAVQTLVAYLATVIGFVPHTTVGVAWTTPLISGYVATGSINGSIFMMINLGLASSSICPLWLSLTPRKARQQGYAQPAANCQPL